MSEARYNEVKKSRHVTKYLMWMMKISDLYKCSAAAAAAVDDDFCDEYFTHTHTIAVKHKSRRVHAWKISGIN